MALKDTETHMNNDAKVITTFIDRHREKYNQETSTVKKI